MIYYFKNELLGSPRSLDGFEIDTINIYPEGRSKRIDICWKKLALSKWVKLDDSVTERLYAYTGRRSYATSIYICRSSELSINCPDFDVIRWKKAYYVLSPVALELFEIFGMTERFALWLGYLLASGTIPTDQQPLLKEQLVSANKSELISKLILPLERRYGDYSDYVYSMSSSDYDGY